MKRISVIKILLLAMVVGAVGCSSYNKLLKVNDSDQMFNAAIDYYNKGQFDRALQLFEEISPRYSTTLRADTIMYYTGCCFYKQGDFATSSQIFDEYRRTYGRSPLLEDVEYMHAMGYYFASPAPSRDQTTTIQAISSINEYLERYPETPKRGVCEMRLEELHNKLFDKSFINARTYYKTRRYKSAIIAFRNALSDYPTTPHREEILYLTLDACFELASNSVSSLQVDRYLDAMDAYYNLISEFPDTKHKRAAERMHRACKNFLAKHNAGEIQSDGSDVVGESKLNTNTNMQ